VLVETPTLGPPALSDVAAALGDRVALGDRPGAAQTAKLVNNAIELTSMVTACEAMVLGVKAGLDPTRCSRPSTRAPAASSRRRRCSRRRSSRARSRAAALPAWRRSRR
jgi:3-hydroxyisobutyrate dehydrogenase-like beta-hydroxyacid dehydrogenase